jgi:hypothetical protein
MSPDYERPTVRQTLGSLLLFSGVAVWGLMLADMTVALPVKMPGSWHTHRPLWGMIGLTFFGLGWNLQRVKDAPPAGWNPGLPGRRFRRAVVYSRTDCHLCDDAKEVLSNYLEYLPEIEEVDIDTDPELKERFGTSIPVVELDGVVRFRGRIDETLLRRLIEGTNPLCEASEVRSRRTCH